MRTTFLSEKFFATKWPIYKGILTGSRFLRERISRGRKECDLSVSTRAYKKDINWILKKKGLENVSNQGKQILCDFLRGR